MNWWRALKIYVLETFKKYLAIDGLKDVITSLVLSYLKLGGLKGMAANFLIKKLVQSGLFAASDFVEKAHDDIIADEYADEMSKGKESNEQNKIDSQLDIINGPR